jgi:hypothetical protein
MQFHQPGSNEGMVLLFRRGENPFRTVEVSLHGLRTETFYELAWDSSGERRRVKGAELAKDFPLTIAEKHRSELIVYRAVGD